MATSAQQATYAAQKGKNWAAPGEAGFGSQGYINQQDYDAYGAANPGATPAPATGGPPAAPGAPQTSAQVLNAAPQAGPPTTVTGAFQSALMNKLSAGPVTAQSASVQPALQANRLASQRGMEGTRALLAERAAAQGIDQNGFNSALLGAQQQSNQAQAGFEGQTVLDQTNADRQQLNALLGLTSGMLGQQDTMGTQRYGIDTDAALRREGIASSSALGQGDLALRGELGRGSLNMGLLGLLSGDRQFDAGLASNNAQFGAGLNQQAVLRMLGL